MKTFFLLAYFAVGLFLYWVFGSPESSMIVYAFAWPFMVAMWVIIIAAVTCVGATIYFFIEEIRVSARRQVHHRRK